jgi:hypothetical protein
MHTTVAQYANNAVAPMADFVTSCGGCRGRPACLPNSKRGLPLCNDGRPCATKRRIFANIVANKRIPLQMGVAGNAPTL